MDAWNRSGWAGIAAWGIFLGLAAGPAEASILQFGGGGIDETPPPPITTLTATMLDDTTVELRWTNVQDRKDNGSLGTLSAVDVWYSNSQDLDDFNYTIIGVDVGAEPAPAAGTEQTLQVGGLTAGLGYHFAIWSVDGSVNQNRSSVSVPNAFVLLNSDTAPPAAVELRVGAGTTEGRVKLEWTAPGDDGAGGGNAAFYDLRYSESGPIASQAAFDQAISIPAPPAGAPGSVQVRIVAGLDPGTDYHFAIKTCDEVPNWSPLSNSLTARAAPAVPPSASVLGKGAVSTTSVTVTWAAPGDDGNVGIASTYDLRYGVSPILDEADFGAATPVAGEPVPGTPGSPQQVKVSNLLPGVTYHFALRTADEVPAWSALSNSLAAATSPPPDLIPPAKVTDLRVSAATDTSVTLEWTAPGDDGRIAPAAAYDLRMSETGPILDEVAFASAPPVDGEPDPALPGTVERMTVHGLIPGSTYHFALKTADEAPNWSALSDGAGVTTVAPDITPPAAVGDLAVTTTSSTSITLASTASGDDGTAGIAASYDLRFSVSPIVTDSDFSSATPVVGEPAPGKGIQAFVVTGLAPGALYHFSLRVSDEAGNWSGRSNPVSVRTTALMQPIESSTSTGPCSARAGSAPAVLVALLLAISALPVRRAA